jgi:hypothetical protein
MIFRLEAVPEQSVRRYFLQVPALLNSLVSGFTVRVANTDRSDGVSNKGFPSPLSDHTNPHA